MKNLAIAGLGYWGQTLIGSVQGASELVRFGVGVARKPETVRALAERRGMHIVDSLDAALAMSDVDGIVLTTPDRLHAQQVIAAARAGKPVLVEKPFTLDRASAELAIAEAKRAGTLVAFAHNRRFLPAVAEMRARIEAGRIGRILHVEGNFSSGYGLRFKPGMWRADSADTVAGGMTGMGIHHMDLMILLAGAFERVQAKGRRQMLEVDVMDNVTASIDFASGATGSFATLITTSPIWRLRILGSKGWIEMLGETVLISAEGNDPVQQITYPAVSTERMELEAFARAIDGEPYPVSVADALHGVSVLEAIAASARDGQPRDVEA